MYEILSDAYSYDGVISLYGTTIGVNLMIFSMIILIMINEEFDKVTK